MNFSHSNSITQAGFTQIPNTVMLRKDLTPTAKLIYGYMKHLAWRNGDEGVDPPRQAIAEDLGLSDKAVTDNIRRLQQAPVVEGDRSPDARKLVAAVRRGLGKTNAYILNDPEGSAAEGPDSGRSGKEESSFLERTNLPLPPISKTDGKKELSPLDPPRSTNRPPKVDRRPVTDLEYQAAAAALAAFNEQAGTRYASRDWIAKIVMRVREHPSLPPAAHAEVIRRALAEPWWRGDPSPSVVYGNAALFERCLHAAAATPTGDRALTPEEIRTFGSMWGPGTGYDSLAEARVFATVELADEDDVIELADEDVIEEL